MKSFNLSEWALNNRAIVLFLILLVTIAGAFSFTKLGQLEDPKFSVPSMTAVIIWPGATAQQVQDEVLNRVEKKFEQLDHFEKVVTYARQGYGGMTISVKDGTSSKDQREAWYQARKKFSDVKSELPEGVVGPMFNDEFGDVFGLMYAVKGQGIAMSDLADTAEDIKRSLLKVPMVKKIDLYGKQAERIYIEFSHERLATLGITPAAIAEALRGQNSVLAAGSIDTRTDRVAVRVTGQFTTEEDIRNVPITAGGKLIKLGDFTTVRRGYEDPSTYTVRHNGQQVLMLAVSMTDEGNVVELGKALDKAVAKVQSELPHGVELEQVADQPTTVKEAVWDFERSLLEALLIVIAVSLVSLGWRTGIVVAASVPLVLGAVAVVMLAMGWNLERISLGSLIIALGLLVDDSIIAIEMMVVKMEGGMDRVKAAAFSYSATAMPRLTGALITVAGFLPIGLSRSSTGEYAGGIFWIVGAAVVLSWVVSGIFTPYLAVKLLPKDFGKHHQGGDPYDTPLYRKLRRAIDFAVDKRWRTGPGLRRHEVRAAAVLPEQLAPRTDRGPAPEGRLLVHGHDRAGQEDGRGAREGRGCALLHRLHRRRLPALLPRAQPRAAEPRLRPVHRDDQGPRGARASALAADGARRRAVPAGAGARHAAGTRPGGGLPGAVPRGRPRHAEGAPDRA
jgi:multidrug efflux pump